MSSQSPDLKLGRQHRHPNTKWGNISSSPVQFTDLSSLRQDTEKLSWRPDIAPHSWLERSNLYKYLPTCWRRYAETSLLHLLTPVPPVSSHTKKRHSESSSPAGAWREFWAVSVNWICVTSWHTSGWAQSVVYHAGSCRDALRENKDKGGKRREKSWQSARTERREIARSPGA